MKETKIDSLVNTVCMSLDINNDIFKNKLSLTLHYLCSVKPDYKEKMIFNYIIEFAKEYYKYFTLSTNLNTYSQELIDLSIKDDVKPDDMENILNKCTETENELKDSFIIPFHESIDILFDEAIENALENKEEIEKVEVVKEEDTVPEIVETNDEEEEVKESTNSFATNPSIFNVLEEFKKIDFSFIEKQEEKLRIEKQKADIVEEIQLHQEILKFLEDDYAKNSNAILELYNQYKELDNYDK